MTSFVLRLIINLLVLSVRGTLSLRQFTWLAEPASCPLKFLMKFPGGVKIIKSTCAGSGSTLEHGHRLSCLVRGNALTGGQTKTYDVRCCSGQLTLDPCEDDSVSARPEDTTTTTTASKFAEATLRCADGSNGQWVKTQGPRTMGGNKQIGNEFVRRKTVKNDEECRAECCENNECWGTVRKIGVKSACWLLLQPAESSVNASDPAYYMEAKPAALCKQKYPYAFPYVDPLDETTVARIKHELDTSSDDYYKNTFYNIETFKRSKFEEADNKDSMSYIARSKGRRVELRFYSSDVGEISEKDCTRLNAITGKHVVRCLGSSSFKGTPFLRVEYAGRDKLSFSSPPIGAPATLVRSLIKQIIVAHLELIADGYVMRDGQTSNFAIQHIVKRDMDTFKLGGDEFLVKVATMQGADALDVVGTDAGAIAAVVESIYSMLSPPHAPLASCMSKATKNDTSSAVLPEFLKSSLRECARKEAGPATEAFILEGGTKMLAQLLGATEGKAALENALNTEYLAIEIPDPDDRRLLFHRSFEQCETVPSDGDKVMCSSGDEEIGQLLGCEPLGKVHKGAYLFYQSTCILPKGVGGNEVKYEPMCTGGEDVTDDALRWGVSFGAPVPKVSGVLTTMKDICCGDKKSHYAAEKQGYYKETTLMSDLKDKLSRGENITFYCSVCGAPLFTLSSASMNRTFNEFAEESDHHGWPSFRDGEILWENLGSYDFTQTQFTEMYDKTSKTYEQLNRNNFESHCKKCGAHVGHNIPDVTGLRLCIDLGCIAGKPPATLIVDEPDLTSEQRPPTETNAPVRPPKKTAGENNNKCGNQVDMAVVRTSAFFHRKNMCKCPKGFMIQGDPDKCKSFIGKRVFPMSLPAHACKCERA